MTASHNCKTCSLRHCTILNKCRTEFLELVNHCKLCFLYKKGQEIFHENSEAHGIYVINRGLVKLQITGFKGKPFILYLANQGAMIGHHTNVHNKHQVSAIAVEDTEVCFIENADFEMIIQKNVGVRADLTLELNKLLQHIYQRTSRLVQMCVHEKVADCLHYITELYNPAHATAPVKMNLTREEIGALIGLNKEQVSKCLTDMRKQKVIAAKGKQLQVLNYKKLQELAGLKLPVKQPA